MENQEITFFKGTHRIIPPSKTIENNESKIKTAGITRITENNTSGQNWNSCFFSY